MKQAGRLTVARSRRPVAFLRDRSSKASRRDARCRGCKFTFFVYIEYRGRGASLRRDESRLLIFVHIPRTGGTTLARVLTRQYPARDTLRLYDSDFGAELADLTPARIDRLRLVLGHFYFGAHNFIPKPCTYITFLRDPVERIISHFYYVRSSPAHYFHEQSRRLNLAAFVEYCSDNDQTRQLAGRCGVPSARTNPTEMLEVAKGNLAEHFVAVGITEDFDRSIVLMKRVLGWRHAFYVRENVSRDHPRRDELSREALDAIRGHNELDLDLYQYARERFREQIRGQGPSFERELQRFRTLNRAYGVLEQVAKKIGAEEVSVAARTFKSRRSHV